MPLDSLLRAFQSKNRSSPSVRLRVAVVGAGRMGQFHLKHLSRNYAATVAGVVDSNSDLARTLAKKYKTVACANPSELLGSIDAAIVATPTPTHFEIGRSLLRAGVSC